MPGRARLTDARRILLARALRGFGDGLVSILLAGYLVRLGLGALQVGTIVTGTLLGSAALTLFVGMRPPLAYRRILLAASALSVATGVGFASLESFWPLLLVAVVGTLNPSAGDVTLYIPVEQAFLAGVVPPEDRTRTFAWYNVGGNLGGAVGALAAGIPDLVSRGDPAVTASGERLAFVLYAGLGLVGFWLYSRLPSLSEERPRERSRPLARSRPIVLRLAALFSLDSFGGGLVVQSLLVLWLYRRFDLSTQAVATIFFVAGLLASFSQLLSWRLAERIGLVETMVYTHLPANVFLMLAGLMPTAPLAVTFLLLRMALSQMDVPARQSYVMAVVPPEERLAASTLTNVPRSLASAAAPLLSGAMLERSTFGWPLILGGGLKAAYDLLLFAFAKRGRRNDLEPPRSV